MKPLSFSLLWPTVLGAIVFPGPRQVTVVSPGVETWTASPSGNTDAITYNVRILAANKEPTLVYNCNHVPALCGSAGRYLGAGVMSGTFHYDGSEQRLNARRRQTCPTGATGWINQKVNGANRCPESGQTTGFWKHEGNAVGVPLRMWVDSAGVTSDRWLGKYELDATTNQWKFIEVPVRLSCDEFPAASWLEGGTGAATYCAPFYDTGGPCGNTGRYRTEQNWQSSLFSQVYTWLQKTASDADWVSEDHIRDFMVLRFKFRMEYSTSGDAVWMEADGKKRYCFGPDPTGSANCKATWPGETFP